MDAVAACRSHTSPRAARPISVSGRERNLFEHGLIVRLRTADGRVVRSAPRTAAAGRWSAQLVRPGNARGSATLEAVALSAKDGALVCIVQVRVAAKP